MILRKFSDFLGMIKFSHTLFALPFALLGAALAARGPDGWRGRPRDWLGIVLCMATARSAAMAFNRLADRRIDALNPRTATRHLPAGTLSAGEVAAFTAGQCGRVRGFHRPVPAEPTPPAPLGARPALAAGLLVRQAVHEPGPLLAGRGADARADGRLDRAPGRPRLASRAAGPGGPAAGSPASTSSTPARTRPSTARPACTASPAASASRAPCGSRRPAMPS